MSTFTDVSTPTRRRLDIGYYRDNGDDSFVANIDERTPANTAHARGKIARVRADAMRDVRFHYGPTPQPTFPTVAAGESELSVVEGVNVTNMPTGGVTGRQARTYGWNGGRLSSVGGFDNGGAPYFAASVMTADGEVSEGGGAQGLVIIGRTGLNTAAMVSTATTIVTTEDQTVTTMRFGAHALPRLTEVSGLPTAVETTRTTFDGQLRLERIVYPRGNAVAYTYLGSDISLRSRNNLRSESRNPGTAGGGGTLSSTIADPMTSYDRRYNLPSGPRIGLDGRSVTTNLSADGTYVASISRGGVATTTILRNAHGQIESTTSEDGVVSGTSYDTATGLPVETREGTRVTMLSYLCNGVDTTNLGKPCRVQPPSGVAIEYQYSATGAVTREARGAYSITLARDRNDRVNMETESTGRRVQHDYSQLGVETLRIDYSHAQPQLWQWVVSGCGQMGRVCSSLTPSSVVTAYDYDRGRLTSVHRGGQPGVLRQTFAYDSNGNLRERSDGVATETITYDGHDRPIERTSPGGSAAMRTTLTYSGADVSRVDAASGAASVSEMIVHPTEGRDPAGRVVRWTADRGEYRHTPGVLSSASTSPGELSTVSTWDSAGRPLSESAQASSGVLQATTYVHSDSSTGGSLRVTQSGEAGSRPQATTSRFDVLGDVSEVEDGAGARLASFTHRPDGAMTQATSGPPSLGITTNYPKSPVGESLGRVSASGVSLQNSYDDDRRLSGEGRAGTSRRTYTYDSAGLLFQIHEPDGGVWTMSNPEPRGLPQDIAMPGGGTMDLSYWPSGQVQRRAVTFNGYTTVDEFDYDGAGRLIQADDRSVAGNNYASRLAISHGLAGLTREVLTTIGPLGTTPYATVHEEAADPRLTALAYTNMRVLTSRDSDGRARHINTQSDGPIATSLSYESNGQLRSTNLGASLIRTDRYDHRGRLEARLYLNLSGAAVSEQRFAYDRADREISQHQVTPGNKISAWTYDGANRVIGQQVGMRPPAAEGQAPTGGYERSTAYAAATDDVVEVTSAGVAPMFAGQRGAADSLGHVESITVNGVVYPRTRDALGNTTSTRLRSGTATMEYDGLSRLRRVVLQSETVISYTYRADGALLTRTVACGANASNCVSGIFTYVYSGLQLLEEHSAPNVNTAPTLRARYYYEDGSDIPLAADLWASANASRVRVYYVTDRMGSVIGVLNESGAYVERLNYDAFGAVDYLQTDVLPPQVASVRTSTNGTLIVEMTEPVTARLTTSSTITAVQLAALAGALRLQEAGTTTPIAGTWAYRTSYPGMMPETVLEFTPAAAPGGGADLELVVHQGTLVDDWSLGVTTTTVAFDWSGAVYTGAAPGITMGGRAETSYSGTGLAWQAHLYDADAGLILARARVIDPISGLYLQRDPELFVDSVNLYAVNANDPINNRDPTGESVPDPRALIAQAKGAVASAAKQCTAGARGAARATAKFMFGQPTDDLGELGYLHMDQVALWSKCEGPIADGSVPPEVCKRAAAMAKVQIATMAADVLATAAAGYAVGQCRVPVAAPKASLRTPQVGLFDLEVPADLAEAIVGGGGGRPSTLRPGAFAKESIPAHYGRPNAAEQRKVNELMSKHGCHTCGAPTPGTKSGNAVADHQPPQALEEPKEFYPHCIDCQRRQGGEVLQELLRRSR